MFFFNRKELFTTRSTQDLYKTLGKLSENNIRYQTKTNTMASAGRSHGIPNIRADAANQHYVYVHKDDYERAKYVVYSK